MALFAKNKPTERVEFEGGFVELQYLSKGVKDEINKRTTEIMKDLPKEVIQLLQKKGLKEEDLPSEMLGVVGNLAKIEHYKLAHAIKSWSESEEVSEETVKELDSPIFDQILIKVTEMNELNSTERKN